MQQQREAVSDLVSQGVSVKAACDGVGLSRASLYRRPMGWRERDRSDPRSPQEGATIRVLEGLRPSAADGSPFQS